jgi:WD40 repeat protein
MKKILIAVIILISAIYMQASTESILQLDTGGHKAKIKDLIVTSDGGHLISASDDKTIRIWKIEQNRESISLTEERKILGQIGNGSEGKIYAIALSPDDKFLATGGYFTNYSADGGAIRIYDYQTGKLLQILKSHSNVVVGLSFSADGRYLVSGSGDNTVKLWEYTTGKFSLDQTFSEHSNDVYAVKIFQYGNDHRIVSAGYDNKINLYSLHSGLLQSYTHSHKLRYLAVSSQYIAACGLGNEIKIFDHSLSLINTIKSETEPSGLAFSPNESWLLAGTGAHPLNCNIYQVDNNFERITSFQQHDNLTLAVTFLNNSTAITGGGNNNEIYFWDINTAEVKAEICGDGKRICSVGISNDKIALANTFTAARGKSEFEKSIDLQDFSVTESSALSGFHRISTTYGDYELEHAKGGDYGYSDAILVIKKNNNTIKEIVRSSTDGTRHNCYGITPSGIIISGGANGYLTAYNLQGDRIADFIGHTGEVWSIAVDNDILVSGSKDQTVKLWDISNLSASSTRKDILPYLNIFVSRDNEWVAWSQSGYYNCSIAGDRYVGYHINHGSEEEAEYLSSDRFYKTYFQPELIANLVSLHDEEKALTFTQKKSRIESVTVDNILPPRLLLNCSSQLSTTSGTVTIDFDVIPQSEHEVTAISIFLNGRDVNERGLKMIRKQTGNSIHITKEITLAEQDNTIKITAENKYALSNPAYITATYVQQKMEDIYKPSLYLLSIGVSKYQKSEYNLDYAAIDAEAVIDIFKNQSGLYKQVDYKLLTDSNASRDNILDGIDWVMEKATQNDVVILYLAGHGINDANNNFYFMSYEADVDRLRRTAVRFSEFQDVIVSLPSKVILMTDACHSGNIMGNTVASRNITSALKDLISAGTGQVIMTATTNNAVAYEDTKWGHGAFTKALEDGLLHYEADYNNDNIITIKEIDLYITNKVNTLTQGKQKPTTIIPASIPDFPIITK